MQVSLHGASIAEVENGADLLGLIQSERHPSQRNTFPEERDQGLSVSDVDILTLLLVS